jgi:hypothetical protein
MVLLWMSIVGSLTLAASDGAAAGRALFPDQIFVRLEWAIAVFRNQDTGNPV